MEINSWIYTVEKLYQGKCVLLYKYEGGICSILLSDNGSYHVTHTDTLPADDPVSDYKSNTEKEKFDLSLIDVFIYLSQNRFLSRRVGFVDYKFYNSLSNMKLFNKKLSQEDFSKFLEKCQLYLESNNKR